MMQSDTEPKFCKDCKHFMRAVGYSPMCFHPRNMSEPDLVYGERSRISSPADLRKPDADCGPDGAMFEAKPPEPPPDPYRNALIVPYDPPQPKRRFWAFLGF